MSNRLSRYTLTGLDLFLGLNAIYGAVWVVPGLPREWLTGTPFADYVVPALALGLVGLGAFAAGVLVAIRPGMGMVLSAVVGAGMMVFELVETSVVGWDLWVHALGLGPIRKGLPAMDTSGIPAPLGIPLPLWLQPTTFLLGAGILALAAGLWRGQPAEPPRPTRLAVRGAAHHA
jgi:hypothetical protein